MEIGKVLLLVRFFSPSRLTFFRLFQVRYELIGKGKSMRYFQIDPDMGTLTLRDDLRKEQDNEYQVKAQKKKNRVVPKWDSGNTLIIRCIA